MKKSWFPVILEKPWRMNAENRYTIGGQIVAEFPAIAGSIKKKEQSHHLHTCHLKSHPNFCLPQIYFPPCLRSLRKE